MFWQFFKLTYFLWLQFFVVVVIYFWIVWFCNASQDEFIFIFLCRITSFSLSLDGKTRLPSDQTTTLSDLGIVGGDLLHVILDNDSAVQSSSATTTHNASTFQSTTSSFNRTSSTGIGNDYNNQSIPSTSSTSRENQPQSENVVRPVNEASEKERQKQGKSQKSPSLLGKDAKLHAPGPSVLNDECQKQRKIEYTPNAMLCRDGTPYSLQSSYEIADVATMHEAICVAVHVLMLETGFINYRKEVNGFVLSSVNMISDLFYP